MGIKLRVIMKNAALHPASVADRDLLSKVRQGQAFRVEVIRESARSADHNRLYWGGLVRLISQYWENEDGFIPVYDRNLLRSLLGWLSNKGFDSKPLETIFDSYLDNIKDVAVSSHRPIENEKLKSETIHNWLKIESGYYNTVTTPTGLVKVARSISFSKMSQEEFNQYYKDAFAVAWNYVFRKNEFSSPEEAQKVAIEMSEMG